MRMTMADGLADPASLTSTGDDCRKAISQGSVAMCLNWTYMYALANDPQESNVSGDIAIAHTPGGPGGSPGINGSMALSITSFSKHPEAALQYIQYLTSKPVQEKYSKLSLPIWKSTYSGSSTLDAPAEVVDVAKKQLGSMVLRPQAPEYNAVSHALQAALQDGMTGDKDPQKALDDAATAAKKIMQGS
jgi:multiple sugar transport system substrate-binding protein